MSLPLVFRKDVIGVRNQDMNRISVALKLRVACAPPWDILKVSNVSFMCTILVLIPDSIREFIVWLVVM